MKTLRFIGMLLCAVFLSVSATSCGDKNEEPTPTQGSTSLTGTKWTWKNRDFSVGDNYANEFNESYTLYFHKGNSGIIYYFSKDLYTDIGTSYEKYAAHFTYTIKGNKVELEYITDPIVSGVSELEFSGSILKSSSFDFGNKESITSDDRQLINSIQGTSGSCMWYSDMFGTLWIVGKGAMADYTSYSNTPWAINKRTPGKRVVVDEGVTTIGSYAFADVNISEVEMPEKSLTKVGDFAFNGSSISRIWLSESTTSIGVDAFADCKRLKDVDIPKNIVSIDDGAFCDSGISVSELKFGSKLRTIGRYTFKGCSASKLTFEEGVESIGVGAFLGDFCWYSRELVLPNSLKSIAGLTFGGRFNKIVIGTGVTEILGPVFMDVASSGEMYLNRTTPPTTNDNSILIDGNNNYVDSSWTLHVPKGSKSAYSAKKPWNRFKSIVEDGSSSGSGEGGGTDTGGDNTGDGTYSSKAQDEKDAASPFRGYVASGFAGGTGTSSDPYRISSAAELRYLSDAVRKGEIFKDKYIVLTSDITINRNVLKNNGELNGDGRYFEPWIPIGRLDPSYFFCGTFDGQGHTISGIYCNRPDDDNVGFFGKLYGNVKNLTLVDSYFKGNSCVGGIAGAVSVFRHAATIPSSITDYYDLKKMWTITSCRNYSTICGNVDVGGIVGSGGLIKSLSKCLNGGCIKGIRQVGGIAGDSSGSNKEATISDCYNKGNIDGMDNPEANAIGGIVGLSYDYVYVYNCLNTGSIRNCGTRVGGIVGWMGRFHNANGIITNCLNITNTLEGTESVGAIVGQTMVPVKSNYYLFVSGLQIVGYADSGVRIYGNRSLTEGELKGTEILTSLNSGAGSKWSKWKTGPDGYPILDWVE